MEKIDMIFFRIYEHFGHRILIFLGKSQKIFFIKDIKDTNFLITFSESAEIIIY